MQTWAKRGLQTALVTGGLLMLGTGIASADEDVNPDRPASPLDGSLTIPVHLDNNAIGTPFGQKDLPSIHKDITISPADLAGGLGVADAATPVADVAAPVTDAAAPVAEQAAPVVDQAKPAVDQAASPATEAVPALGKAGAAGLDDPFMGNRVNGDLVVPIDISGNAIALGGEAEVENDSSQTAEGGSDVETSGGGFLAGNVVDLDYALPIQITGNALSVIGDASSVSTSTQDASATGDIVTDGSDGALGGNVLAGQFATPLQITGNAIAGGGDAETDSQAETTGTAGGSILSGGSGSFGGGNVGAAPVAVPVEVNGNALAGFGAAESDSESSAYADAGKEREGLYGVPTYIETSGGKQGMTGRDEGGAGGVLAGNVAQAPVSGPALLCGNAGAAAGTAEAGCTSDSETNAGGGNRTTGAGGALSGTIAQSPVALPVEGFGNAAAGAGEAEATADNTVASTAGGDAYTRGHESLGSGTVLAPSASGPVDVFANTVAGAGATGATATNDVEAISGGNSGTTGDDSLLGGNMSTNPVSLPVEGFGNGGAAAGTTSIAAEETKVSTSGGGSNTDDDNGAGASNLVSTPVASAAQLFGNGVGAASVTDTKAKTDNEVTAGGPANATGKGGLLSGNIGQAPVAGPIQGMGNGVTGIGEGTEAVVSDGVYTAGGDATSTGADGLGSGNVVTGPAAGAGQLFGNAAAVLGSNDALAGSVTESSAGGDTETDGSGGALGGNVAAPQTLPVVQGFGDAVAALGGAGSSVSTNETDATSGGDIDTNGDGAFLSGNLADVPAAGVVQPFGDAVSAVGGYADGTGLSDTEGDVGGVSTTSGELGSLSGIDGTMPLPVELPIYDVPVEIIAEAITNSANASDIGVGEEAGMLDLPLNGALGATELPTMMPARSMSAPEPGAELVTGAFTGVLDGFTAGSTGLPGADTVTEVAGGLAEAPGQYHVLPYPQPRDLPGMPELPTDQLDGLPINGTLPGLPSGDVAELPFSGDLFDVTPGNLPSVPEVPGLGDVTDVPAMPAVPGLGDVTDVPAMAQVPGLDNLTAVPAMPEVPGLGDVTAVPSVPGLGDATELPAMPAVPGLDGLTDLPGTPQVPGLGELPATPDVTTIVPTVPGIDAVPAPGLSDVDSAASLADTKAALANLFANHPIG